MHPFLFHAISHVHILAHGMIWEALNGADVSALLSMPPLHRSSYANLSKRTSLESHYVTRGYELNTTKTSLTRTTSYAA